MLINCVHEHDPAFDLCDLATRVLNRCTGNSECMIGPEVTQCVSNEITDFDLVAFAVNCVNCIQKCDPLFDLCDLATRVLNWCRRVSK